MAFTAFMMIVKDMYSFHALVLEMISCGFKPDIIHTNDWQTALVPVYYQIFYKYQQGYENIKNVFTIHNISIR